MDTIIFFCHAESYLLNLKECILEKYRKKLMELLRKSMNPYKLRKIIKFPRTLAIWLIRRYQSYSATRPPNCRFLPTCSAYAVTAYQRFGFFWGTMLSLWRILRCNPFNPGGYDPVPETLFKRRKRGQ